MIDTLTGTQIYVEHHLYHIVFWSKSIWSPFGSVLDFAVEILVGIFTFKESTMFIFLSVIFFLLLSAVSSTMAVNK